MQLGQPGIQGALLLLQLAGGIAKAGFFLLQCGQPLLQATIFSQQLRQLFFQRAFFLPELLLQVPFFRCQGTGILVHQAHAPGKFRNGGHLLMQLARH